MLGPQDTSRRKPSITILVLGTLVLILVLGVALLLDRSLRHSERRQAVLNATASARIVAMELQLVSNQLKEDKSGKEQGNQSDTGRTEQDTFEPKKALLAVWVFDSSGTRWNDSLSWGQAIADTTLFVVVRQLAEGSQMEHERTDLDLRQVDLSNYRHALLVKMERKTRDRNNHVTVVALVDEEALLRLAAAAIPGEDASLMLLMDRDTVASTGREITQFRSDIAARIAIPGAAKWSVVSTEIDEVESSRWDMWLISAFTLGILVVGFIREHRQTRQATERSLELERLSTELLRANRMKSQFLASVSHELRTPLNAIVGFVDLLRDGAYGNLQEKQITPVERIASSATRLRAQVDQILDIAKITAGRMDVRLESVGIRSFLLGVVGEIEPLLNARNLRLTMIIIPEEIRIRTDPSHLRQILINVLGNAVKYTKAGEITIEVRVELEGPDSESIAVTGQHPAFRVGVTDRWIQIGIRDTGPGISREDQSRIFDEFEQVQVITDNNTSNQGTGLGLPISRRLAALLGGDITMKSELGEGSVFSVWLPVRE
jgi:signal transduction histidine kinase